MGIYERNGVINALFLQILKRKKERACIVMGWMIVGIVLVVTVIVLLYCCLREDARTDDILERYRMRREQMKADD